jgi:hypothetical protein
MYEGWKKSMQLRDAASKKCTKANIRRRRFHGGHHPSSENYYGRSLARLDVTRAMRAGMLITLPSVLAVRPTMLRKMLRCTD